MRKTIREFVSIVAGCLPIREPIYEFGSLQVPGQENVTNLRPIFPGRNYVGADMREGPGVDRILNLHSIDLPPESAGTVLCLDTLEHVEYPSRALEEIHRILIPDGIALISSVMQFPIHDYPNDYWRFTPEAFKSLLKPFTNSFVGFAGRADFPHTVVGIGFKGKLPSLSELESKYRRWQTLQKYSWLAIVKNVTPPILLPVLFKAYGALKRITRRRPQTSR